MVYLSFVKQEKDNQERGGDEQGAPAQSCFHIVELYENVHLEVNLKLIP